MGCKNIRMYSGFRLTNTGQVWNMTSTVLRFPLLEISLRNTDGGAERFSFGTYNPHELRRAALKNWPNTHSQLERTECLANTGFDDIRILIAEHVRD